MLLQQKLMGKRPEFLNTRSKDGWTPFELLLNNGPSASLLLFLEDTEAKPFPGTDFKVIKLFV